jgi:hypothetical protein
LTIDEELTHLDSLLRRLKIEYEVYFNNPSKRPPADLEWKAVALIRKYSDGGRLSFSQRFRYNEMAQRYAIYSDLWRKKMRIREEGYRRPQDALLSVQGVRVEEHAPKHHHAYGVAKKKSGEEVSGNLESFSTFVRKKTDQIRKQYGCKVVQYSVELHDGQVKLKAKAKT